MDRCHLSPGRLAAQRMAQLAGELGEVCPRTHSQQKTDWAGAGQRGPVCQAGRLPGTWWQQTGPNTGANTSLRRPGCARGLMTHQRVGLAGWGPKAASQGLGRTFGDWSQEQAGHLPREGGKERRRLAGAARAEGACPQAVLLRPGLDLQAPGGKRLSPGPRPSAG